jgi:hypothetical protein
LGAINDDVQEWVESWNHHRISLRGEVDRSPRDLFVFGIIQGGVRGMDTSVDEDVVDPDTYGVDWDVHEDPTMREYLAEQYAIHGDEENIEDPLDDEYDVAIPPFSDDFVNGLEERLSHQINLSSRNMTIRRLIWETALRICCDIELEHNLDRYVHTTF